MDVKQYLDDRRVLSDGKVLNIGSGGRPLIGKTNLDIHPNAPYVDTVWDVEKGLPYDDNEFDQVICFHILEHVRDLKRLIADIWRCTKNGASVYIDAPHYTNPMFWDDITHVRPWSDGTAKYIEKMMFKKDGVEGHFKVTLDAVMGNPWDMESPTVSVVNLETVKEKP